MWDACSIYPSYGSAAIPEPLTAGTGTAILGPSSWARSTKRGRLLRAAASCAAAAWRARSTCATACAPRAERSTSWQHQGPAAYDIRCLNTPIRFKIFIPSMTDTIQWYFRPSGNKCHSCQAFYLDMLLWATYVSLQFVITRMRSVKCTAMMQAWSLLHACWLLKNSITRATVAALYVTYDGRSCKLASASALPSCGAWTYSILNAVSRWLSTSDFACSCDPSSASATQGLQASAAKNHHDDWLVH